MGIFIMTTGLPASGKSTWTRNMVKSGYTGEVIRVNRDDIREMLHNSRWSPANEAVTVTVRDASIRAAMAAQTPLVISDDTNLDPKVRGALSRIAREHGYSVIIRDFTHIPVDICIERDSLRSGKARVGESVIRGMYDKYLRE